VVNDSKFICYVTYSLSMKRPIWTSIFFSKALVSRDCCNIDVLFSTMVENCSKTLIFCFLFCFVTSSRMIGLFKSFFQTSSLEPLSGLFENLDYPQFHQFNLQKHSHASSHFNFGATNCPMHHKKDTHDDHYLKSHLQFCHLCIACKLH